MFKRIFISTIILILCFISVYPLLIEEGVDYPSVVFITYYRAFLWLIWTLIISLFFFIVLYLHRNTSKRYWKLYLINVLLITLIVGSISIKIQVDNEKRVKNFNDDTFNDNKVENLSLLISMITKKTDDNSEEKTSNEVYRFDLEGTGKLKVSYGLISSSDINDISQLSVIKQDSIMIMNSRLENIIELAQTIYNRKEYDNANDQMSNAWFVQLRINHKINNYGYRKLDIDTIYSDIVDKIIAESPIEVKNW